MPDGERNHPQIPPYLKINGSFTLEVTGDLTIAVGGKLHQFGLPVHINPKDAAVLGPVARHVQQVVRAATTPHQQWKEQCRWRYSRMYLHRRGCC